MLTYDRLKEVLHYDPETGVFTWLSRPEITYRVGNWNARWAGKVAGCPMIRGQYWGIGVDSRTHGAHRLAVLYMTGEWPANDVDHINCDGTDNRWINLRVANRSQNCGNSRKARNNTSGFKGVSFDRATGMWKATIGKNRKTQNLGRYSTREQAYAVYCRAAALVFGEFARTA